MSNKQFKLSIILPLFDISLFIEGTQDNVTCELTDDGESEDFKWLNDNNGLDLGGNLDPFDIALDILHQHVSNTTGELKYDLDFYWQSGDFNFNGSAAEEEKIRADIKSRLKKYTTISKNI